PFHTAKSIAAVTLPAIERGIAMAGRARKDVKLSFQIMVASGSNDEEIERTRTLTKGQIAVYGSTPAYRGLLAARGRREPPPEHHALAKRGQWNEMTGLISDESLETVAVCAPMDRVAARVRERCGQIADRVSLLAHWSRDPEPWAEVARELSR